MLLFLPPPGWVAILQWKLAQRLSWFGLETSPVKADNTPHFELNPLENLIIQEK